MTTVTISIDRDFGSDSNDIFPGVADMFSVFASADSSGSPASLSFTRAGFGSEIINVGGNHLTATPFDVGGNIRTLTAYAFADPVAHLTIVADGAWASTYGGGISISSLAQLTVDSLVTRIKLLTPVNLVLFGNVGDDALHGSNYSDDALYGLKGADTIDGGGGVDTAFYDGSSGGVGINLVTGLGAGSDAAGDRLIGIEYVTSLNFADTVTGDGNYNLIDCLLGFDIVHAGNGYDTVFGRDGGGEFFGDGGNDRIDGGVDDDTIHGGTGDDELRVGYGHNVAYGDDGDDTLLGATGSNNFFGGAGGDTIDSVGGTDTLDGGTGADVLSGSAGTQVFYVDNTGDFVNEDSIGDGDRVLSSVSYALQQFANIELLMTTNTAGNASINLTGSNAGQRLVGNAGVNVLNGGGGADLLQGLGGSDTYWVDNAADVVDETPAGSNGTDTVTTGNVSINLGVNNFFKGAIENVTLGNNTTLNAFGNALANTLTGNVAVNTLDGGLGADTLKGLAGADTFRFTTALGAANIDAITDYNVAADRITIDNAVFTGLANNALPGAAFFAGAAAHDLDDRIIYNGANGRLYFDADGNKAGGVAAIQFATLTAGLAMGAGEFMVI